MSIARWSMRPLTGSSGTLASNCSGAASVCAFAINGLSSRSASSTRRAPRSALRKIDMRQRRLQPGRELQGIVMRPEMHEVEARLLADHVVVQSRDLDAILTQGFHNWRDFFVDQNEIAGNRRLAASERLKIDGVRQAHARRHHHVLFLDCLSARDTELIDTPVVAALGAERAVKRGGVEINRRRRCSGC